MPIVCGIRFRGTGKVYHFSPGEIQDLQTDDYVIVETARGVELGQVIMPAVEVDQAEIVAELKPVLRRASPADLLDAEGFRQQEPGAVIKCKELAAKLGLAMKIISAEYNYDGTRLTFFFTAEQRVDFRELVRELAHAFRTRIELRQVGVRDEAKIMGGIGKCGRPLCCASWLTEFCPVSIRMAKQQDLPLSPMEISGLCGRLLCCLEYENGYYQEVKGRFPKVGKSIETPLGPGKVIKVSALKETVSILLADGSTLELTAEQLAGNAAITVESTPSALNNRQRQALDAALPPSSQRTTDSPKAGPPDRPADQADQQHVSAPAGAQRDRGREADRAEVLPTTGPERADRGDRNASAGPVAGRASHRRQHFRRARPSPDQGRKPPAAGQGGESGRQGNPAARPPEGGTSRRDRRPRRRGNRRREISPQEGNQS